MRWTSVAGAAAALVLGAAAPAMALDIPPIDNPRWGLAYDLGATTVGGQLALGPLRLGCSGYMGALPGLDKFAGFTTTVAWRCSPHEWGGLAWGLGVTNYVITGLSTSPTALEGYGVYPALVGTLPLGDEVVLRASAGPLVFSGQTDWERLGDGRRVRRGATGFVPVFPNVQLAWKLEEGSELTLGGYPSLVGYRVAI